LDADEDCGLCPQHAIEPKAYPCAKVALMMRRTFAALAFATVVLVSSTGCTQQSSTRSSSPTVVAVPTTRRTVTTTAAPPPTPAPTTTTAQAPQPPPTTAPAPASGIQIGPGAQAVYAVQPQPSPGSCHYTYVGSDPLPDPHCTPGAVDPQVTQDDIGSTICSSGFTSTIRPPESVTEPEKEASAAAYGYTGSFHVTEYDHLIPLELGGDPNDPANLWVEPPDNPNATSFANTKDQLESRLNDLACSGQLSLAAAQQAIASNWVTAYQTYG
jgi:hypothetical protein